MPPRSTRRAPEGQLIWDPPIAPLRVGSTSSNVPMADTALPRAGTPLRHPYRMRPLHVRPVPPRGCVTCGRRTPAGRSRSSARRHCPACPRRCGTRSSAGSSRRRHGFVGRRGPSPSPRLPSARASCRSFSCRSCHRSHRPAGAAGRPCRASALPDLDQVVAHERALRQFTRPCDVVPEEVRRPTTVQALLAEAPRWHRSPDRPRLHRRPARADRHCSPDRPCRPSSRLSPIPGQPVRRRPPTGRPCPSPSSSGCGTNRRRGSRPSRCPAWRPHRCSADGSPDRHAATSKRGEFPFGPSGRRCRESLSRTVPLQPRAPGQGDALLVVS